jgi:hypothetical protein
VTVDASTLVLCNALITACLAASLLIYRTGHKTYPGYSVWTIGTCLLATGYLVLILQRELSLWPSFLLSDVAFALGGLLRLEGVRALLGRRRLPRAAYAAPVLLLAALGYLRFVYDSVFLRVLATNIFIAIVCFASAAAILRPDTRGQTFYRIFGGLHLAGGLLLVFRSESMLVPRHGPFDPATVQLFFLVALTVFEVGVGLSFIMLNAERLATELRASRDSLDGALRDLQTTVAQVRVLRGLLPICASCKKVRDDHGYWQQIEAYIADHSEAAFSHGICPECAARLYPEIEAWEQRIGAQRPGMPRG